MLLKNLMLQSFCKSSVCVDRGGGVMIDIERINDQHFVSIYNPGVGIDMERIDDQHFVSLLIGMGGWNDDRHGEDRGSMINIFTGGNHM